MFRKSVKFSRPRLSLSLFFFFFLIQSSLVLLLLLNWNSKNKISYRSFYDAFRKTMIPYEITRVRIRSASANSELVKFWSGDKLRLRPSSPSFRIYYTKSFVWHFKVHLYMHSFTYKRILGSIQRVTISRLNKPFLLLLNLMTSSGMHHCRVWV